MQTAHQRSSAAMASIVSIVRIVRVVWKWATQRLSRRQFCLWAPDSSGWQGSEGKKQFKAAGSKKIQSGCNTIKVPGLTEALCLRVLGCPVQVTESPYKESVIRQAIHHEKGEVMQRKEVVLQKIISGRLHKRVS